MPENLTPAQHAAVRALLTHPNVNAAAEQAEVSRDTIYRWMREPEFQAALREGQQFALEGVARSLVHVAQKAITTLEGAMDDPAFPPAVRVRAADATLMHLLRIRELTDLESRMRAIEEGLTR